LAGTAKVQVTLAGQSWERFSTDIASFRGNRPDGANACFAYRYTRNIPKGGSA
jgi:hypothetical protein